MNLCLNCREANTVWILLLCESCRLYLLALDKLTANQIRRRPSHTEEYLQRLREQSPPPGRLIRILEWITAQDKEFS